jgi:hypothetical protein
METKSTGGSITELPMEIQEILKNTDYPIKRKDIIEQARKNGAIPDILRALGMLPDKEFNNAEDIAKELHRLYIVNPV